MDEFLNIRLSNMSKYVRKGTCVNIEGNLYKAVDPKEFADCKGCAFDDVCNHNSKRIDRNKIPYCSIEDRRSMDDIIFIEASDAELFVDVHKDKGEKLEKQIKDLVTDYARLYDEADIDKQLGRFDQSNRKRTAAKNVKKKINKLKDELYNLK